MTVDVELRWGYTLADLQRVARSAAATTRAMGGDYEDRYSEAYSAAAEALYAADRWIPEHALFRAAQDALREAGRKSASYHGHAHSHRTGQWSGPGTAPNFMRWWDWVTAPTPSPEHRVVERLALVQILPLLTRREREVIGALAVFDDHQAAREALGASDSRYSQTLSRARRRFLAAWHEGEAPSRPWGRDCRGYAGQGSRLNRVMALRAYRAKVRAEASRA